MIADEFILGRAGKWLSLSFFFRLPGPDRRTEFVFGTAAEVMQVLEHLPLQATSARPGREDQYTLTAPEPDEMAAAYHADKTRLAGPKRGTEAQHQIARGGADAL